MLRRGVGPPEGGDGPEVVAGPPAEATGERLLTVPNLVSVGRLLCVPVFLYLLFGARDRYAAALLLGFLGTTDWVDGYVARHFGQVTTLGKVLDPVADRVLLLTGMISILADGSVPVWVGVLAIGREALVGVAALVLGILRVRRIDVTWFGKAGTFAMMVAFPLFLTNHSTASWHDLAGSLAWVFVVPGLGLAWYSVLAYVPLARDALTAARVGSGGETRAGGASVG